jgi:hypothetical protein
MGEWCKYYTGLHDKTCEKGHRYLDFGPEFGIAKIVPCILRNENPKPCTDLELKTQDELDAEEKALEEFFQTVFIVRPLIIAQGKSAGQVACPKCTGVIDYDIASNGHIRARCNTSGCIQWME